MTKATHPLQSKEWAEFRKKTGVKVVNCGEEFVTIHKIPRASWNIGYMPKGQMPTKKTIEMLTKIGTENKCVFIQLEPNVPQNSKFEIRNSKLREAAHPLFTKYTFILDLTQSEEELLKNMHSKTRYNIRVAQKHGVEVKEETSEKAFKEYLKLTDETTKRQKFYAHTPEYHRLMWEILGIRNQESGIRENKNHNSLFMIHNSNKLTAHLLVAYYKKIPLVTWIVFAYRDTLYYPYGASSTLHRETMASNLMMWKTIKFGKKLGLKTFDMWGALGPEPDPKDPWYGFHRFKQGYGPKLVEFVGSYDLVIKPMLYEVYKVADKLRWFLLKVKK